MAYDVTSEWDDIHWKLGNYEPLPIEKKEHEYTKEYIDRLEEIYWQEKDQEFSSDEEIMQSYKRKMIEKQQQEKTLKEITAQDYIWEVNNAGEDVCVLLNFYQPYNQLTLLINEIFKDLQREFPQVKFLITQATKCIENFPDYNLPYILYYRNEQLLQQISKEKIPIKNLSYQKLIELFQSLQIKEFIQQKEVNAKEFIQEKLQIKKYQNSNENSSDEEEREDKQFISNKIFIKY